MFTVRTIVARLRGRKTGLELAGVVSVSEAKRPELKAVEKAAKRWHAARLPRCPVRIDLPDGRARQRLYVLELNPLPGLTPDQIWLLIGKAINMDYRTLIPSQRSWRQRLKRLREKRRGAVRDATEESKVEGLSVARLRSHELRARQERAG